MKKALVIIDIQNDITKNYKEIIDEMLHYYEKIGGKIINLNDLLGENIV